MANFPKIFQLISGSLFMNIEFPSKSLGIEYTVLNQCGDHKGAGSNSTRGMIFYCHLFEKLYLIINF